MYLIKQKAEIMGLSRKGNMIVERILTNPVYAGLLKTEAFKDHPGGLFPGIHEPIIDLITWKMIQSKFKRVVKARTIIDDSLPLRGILKCYCGNLLTGAPSRGKSGKYFYYYKCRFSGHNNISANKAHDQFDKILDLMSLSSAKVAKIKNNTKNEIEKELEINRIRLVEKKGELSKEKELLYSVEDKYIKNEIDFDTYKRWFSTYKDKIDSLEFAVMRLEKTGNEAFTILDRRLELAGDVKYIYRKSDTLEKREFLDLVFDSNLYYEKGIYRTPTMMEALSHNVLKMKELGVLIVE